jgi:NAD(P)H-nitrite reductase large subunit
VGEIAARGDDGAELRVEDGHARRYRKLVLAAGRLRGAIAIGHPELADAISAAVQAGQDVTPVLPALARGDWLALGS